MSWGAGGGGWGLCQSPTYFTKGRTNLPREAIGPNPRGPIASRGDPYQYFKINLQPFSRGAGGGVAPPVPPLDLSMFMDQPMR